MPASSASTFTGWAALADAPGFASVQALANPRRGFNVELLYVQSRDHAEIGGGAPIPPPDLIRRCLVRWGYLGEGAR